MMMIMIMIKITIDSEIRGVVKNHGYFTVRLIVRGGGGVQSTPSALTDSECENFDPPKRAKNSVFGPTNTCFWTHPKKITKS